MVKKDKVIEYCSCLALSPQNKYSTRSKQQQGTAMRPFVCEAILFWQRGPCLINLCPFSWDCRKKTNKTKHSTSCPPSLPKQENKTWKRQIDAPLHPIMVGKTSHTPNLTQHWSQQCCASMVSTDCASVLPGQPPAQANRQKWSNNVLAWSIPNIQHTARRKVEKACEWW